MSGYFEWYPELNHHTRDEKASIIEQARYRAFRKKGNNAKIAVVATLVVLVAFFAKLQIDLFLVKYINEVVSGVISGLVVFPIGYIFIKRTYSSIVRNEFSALLIE